MSDRRFDGQGPDGWPGASSRGGTHGAVGEGTGPRSGDREELSLKQQVFEQIDRHVPESAVIATNTSSLPVVDVAVR